LAALTSCAPGSASAATVTLGLPTTSLNDLPNNNAGCTPGQTCTLLQETLSGANAVAPGPGVIVSWSIAHSAGTFDLRLLKSGQIPGTYVGITSTPLQPIPTATTPQTFQLSPPLPIAQGQRLAIDLDSVSAGVGAVTTTMDGVSAWQPQPHDGGTGSAPTFVINEHLLFNATELLAPSISGTTPATGSTHGGTTVTITGSSLANATSVMFGSQPATNVTATENAITATSPPQAAGPVDITVTTAAGTSAVTSADRFTYALPAPRVTKLSPKRGSVKGGNAVVISGTDFTQVSAVHFGHAAARFGATPQGTLLAIAPKAKKAGRVAVTVTTPGGTSTAAPAARYTYRRSGRHRPRPRT
jgi:hypothetical protein